MVSRVSDYKSDWLETRWTAVTVQVHRELEPAQTLSHTVERIQALHTTDCHGHWKLGDRVLHGGTVPRSPGTRSHPVTAAAGRAVHCVAKLQLGGADRTL
jgi:hypothetical protein